MIVDMLPAEEQEVLVTFCLASTPAKLSVESDHKLLGGDTLTRVYSHLDQWAALQQSPQ